MQIYAWDHISPSHFSNAQGIFRVKNHVFRRRRLSLSSIKYVNCHPTSSSLSKTSYASWSISSRPCEKSSIWRRDLLMFSGFTLWIMLFHHAFTLMKQIYGELATEDLLSSAYWKCIFNSFVTSCSQDKMLVLIIQDCLTSKANASTLLTNTWKSDGKEHWF